MLKTRKVLNTSLDVLAGGSLLVMVLLTVWQVFTRYILKNPSSWSEELVSYMFAWSSLFGAAIVSGEREHMNILALVEKFSHGKQVLFGIVSEVVALIFALAILVFGGVQIANLAMGQMTSSLGVPIGIFYVVLPVAGILIVLYSILNIVDILKGNIPPVNVVQESSKGD